MVLPLFDLFMPVLDFMQSAVFSADGGDPAPQKIAGFLALGTNAAELEAWADSLCPGDYTAAELPEVVYALGRAMGAEPGDARAHEAPGAEQRLVEVILDTGLVRYVLLLGGDEAVNGIFPPAGAEPAACIPEKMIDGVWLVRRG